MTTVLSPRPKQQFLDNNGLPANKYRVFTYQAGTTTKLSTYTDSTGGILNTNPITLDARGECNLWIPPNVSYKFLFAYPGIDDPPTASTIWSVDNIVNSQLITLYGGVDTGTANNYILNFTANFSAYADGIVIYWIPANTNTTSSTINVNGLGVVSIINASGSSLQSGQIIANAPSCIIYKGGSFILMTTQIIQGSFVGNVTGCTTSITPNVNYTLSGNMATLIIKSVGDFVGTSNSTGLSLGGIPPLLQPANFISQAIAFGLYDNGLLQNGMAQISGGSMAFGLGINGTVFTASGTKGISKNFNICYPIY